MTTSTTNYPEQRFPPEMIDHAICLYSEFAFSLRDVALILAEPAAQHRRVRLRPFEAARRVDVRLVVKRVADAE